ncbi:hypothetical protein CJ030_MR1G014141 [Morella rubra]|uniref:Uncharacterized protein n=1 Tax=Morella rubra TaxID=262757 RepID=A0A6A1WMP5_9ROSI|nr:hypothetical protein CJ030_MR1G014141 [Morella rubra]
MPSMAMGTTATITMAMAMTITPAMETITRKRMILPKQVICYVDTGGNGTRTSFVQSKGSLPVQKVVRSSQCLERKLKKNKKQKGCFVDGDSKCEVTGKCKHPFPTNFFLPSL